MQTELKISLKTFEDKLRAFIGFRTSYTTVNFLELTVELMVIFFLYQNELPRHLRKNIHGDVCTQVGLGETDMMKGGGLMRIATFRLSRGIRLHPRSVANVLL